MNSIMKITLVSATLAGSAAADLVEKDLSRLKLRPQAYVRGNVVTLADVLVFTHADPRLLSEIGDESVVDGPVQPGATRITHDQIVSRLENLGVNLARVLVSGALACEVTIEQAAMTARTAALPGSAPLLREPVRDHDEITLADVLRDRLGAEFAETDGTVDVEFERAGQEFLELTTPPFDFAIRGSLGQKLGLREFHVTLRRDGRTQRTVRIGANVKLIKKVLVAAKPLNIGTYVKRDGLELASRVFTEGSDLGIDHPEQVIGQRVRQFVPAGQMIRAGDLKAVDLVRRAQPVTVTGGDNVSIRVTGDALDSGGFGDTIRVRLGNSRENRREIRGVVTGVGMVQLTDDGL